MYIKNVTITGADDHTKPEDLLALSLQYPMVEWAILFSEKKEGTARYPSKAWRGEFYSKVPNVFRSAHLCGKPYLEKFGYVDNELEKELFNYQRLQLNFNRKHVNDDLYKNLVDNTKNKVFNYKTEYPITVITQYNDANALVHNDFKCPNHAVLFDASGGHGVVPSELPLLLDGYSCGYAGGINPENIDEMLEKIQKASGSGSIWVDMESGVRTNELLDLDKVTRVLDKVVKYQIQTIQMDF